VVVLVGKGDFNVVLDHKVATRANVLRIVVLLRHCVLGYILEVFTGVVVFVVLVVFVVSVLMLLLRLLPALVVVLLKSTMLLF